MDKGGTFEGKGKSKFPRAIIIWLYIAEKIVSQ